MKIKNIGKNSRRFADVETGSVFQIDGELFMKVFLYADVSAQGRGVLLSKGMLRNIHEDTVVEPINGTFVVEK